MSDQNYYERLGLTEDASFEEIQERREQLLQELQGDSQKIETVEAAYDAILMERLRMRQQGKIKVPERIRFPERLSPAPPNFAHLPVSRTPAWLQRLIDTPNSADILWPAGVFSVLTGLTIFFPGTNGGTIQLTIALGVILSLFFLNRKERKLGRALLLTLAALIMGIGLGSLLSDLLSTQLASVNLKVDQFATLVTFFLLWLVTSFLR